MSQTYDGVEIVGVREAHRLNEAALADHLAAHLDGFEGPLTVSQFEGGQSNPTYLLATPRRDYVMRKKPPGELLPSAHAVDREYRVMTALAESDVPVPETLLFVEDESVVGTPFFVMERVPGRVLVDPLLPGLSAADRRALYDHFAEVLAALHTVDHEAVGLGDFGRPGSYYARQIGRWTKQYRASETETIPAMDRLIEWLPENVPESDTVGIVHGDYRIGNCIVHPTEPRIVAVLDWELSTLGHPLADLSYACMGYHADLGHIENFIGIDFEATGIPTEADFIARYCAATGREEIENWSFYVAFSLFRVAAIIQGVYKRGLDGIASSERAVSYKDDCRLRAEQAWALVRD